MSLVKLYQKESETSGTSLLVMSVISGIANAYILKTVISAADAAGSGQLNHKFIPEFIVAFAFFFIGKRYAMIKAIAIVEDMLHKVRDRLSVKITDTELVFLEHTAKEEIYTKLTHDTNQISDSAHTITNAFNYILVFFFCMIYIGYLSLLAFAVTVALIGGGTFAYLTLQRKITQDIRRTSEKESRYFEMLGHAIDGFKELKMNRKKRSDYTDALSAVGQITKRLKIRTGFGVVTASMFGQVFFSLLIGITVFVLSQLGHVSSEVIIKVTTAILFMSGPITVVVTTIPTFLRAGVAIENIYSLEDALDKAAENLKRNRPLIKISQFNEIRFDSVSFRYTFNGETLFRLEPFSLSVRRGEILFVVGGNGSGKSTFMKLLTGLYTPESGNITIDGTDIRETDYKELFSLIFTDFHLFNCLYGLEGIDHETVNQLLKIMNMDHKTKFVGNRFTNIHLSTGQRKRLAMIITLLEDKPICVFDEWAADQDPKFRQYFYEVLLKEMKAQGKTVIAVSHDDRYFHCADRVMKMEMGRFVSEEIGTQE